jgi:predicted membrane metal-binding protein
MQDTVFLHFLRQFPAWIVLFVLTLVFVALYYLTNDISYKEWTSLLMTSLFTALGMQRALSSGQSANTTSGDVNIVPNPMDLQDIKPDEIEKAVEGLEKK